MKLHSERVCWRRSTRPRQAASSVPNLATNSPSGFYGPHPGGCAFLDADGSVRLRRAEAVDVPM